MSNLMEKPIFEPILHDGRHDSLTNLLAPPLYYEEITRELARLQRREMDLCIVRIEIPSTSSNEEIMEFADSLINTARSEDVLARVGEYEFGLLFRGDEKIIQKFLARLEIEIEIDYSCTKVRIGEVTLDLLNRLDQIELTRTTTSLT